MKMNLYDFRLDVIRSLLPPLDGPVERTAQKRARLEMHKIKKLKAELQITDYKGKIVASVVKLSGTRKHHGVSDDSDEDVVEDSHHFSDSEQSADEKQPNEEAENSGPADEEEAGERA
ncbi:hypothetical protein J6590_090047 [Homalodisca vitripennis]|nr:hypothetical protein J6590_090047 [Homalodisca vitripennis]